MHLKQNVPADTEPSQVDHLVIGTGFSGIATAIAIARNVPGSLQIVERADSAGGVWRDNDYPGCSCDVPSHLYSLSEHTSFSWSRRYPPRAEILQYLRNLCRDHRLDDVTVYGKTVTRLEWLEHQGRWLVDYADGGQLMARFIYAATGQLPRNKFPASINPAAFSGKWFHSSQWRHDIDLAGRRVGVVGTGASAIQLIPKVAEMALHLTVFQRNAAYVMPRGDRAFTRWQKWLLSRVPAMRALYRGYIYCMHELNGIAFFSVPALLGIVRWKTSQAIRKNIASAEVRRNATPRYAAGCKRILVSDDYYPALARPNVTLAREVERIEGNEVICPDGSRHQLDVLIFATGFEGTLPMPGIEVIGRDDERLHHRWEKTGVSAFYGTQVAGFPNLFLLIGPNVGLGHNSVLYMMEAQVRLIIRLVKRAIANGGRAEVRSEIQRKFNQKVDMLMQKTRWQTGGCTSWYHDSDGRNVGLWPTYTFLFRWWSRNADAHSQTED
jgi:cation diffusion facilitator CzcD-associated flavoprotein CzcO